MVGMNSKQQEGLREPPTRPHAADEQEIGKDGFAAVRTARALRSASISSTMSATVVATASTVRAAQVQPARAAARQGAPALRRAFAGAQLVQAKQQQRAQRAVGLQVRAAGPKLGGPQSSPLQGRFSRTIGRCPSAPTRCAVWTDGPTLPPLPPTAAPPPAAHPAPSPALFLRPRCWP